MAKILAWFDGDSSDPRLGGELSMRILALGEQVFTIERGITDALGATAWLPFTRIESNPGACALDRGHLRQLFARWTDRVVYFVLDGERKRMARVSEGVYRMEAFALAGNAEPGWQPIGPDLDRDHPRQRTWSNALVGGALEKMSFPRRG